MSAPHPAAGQRADAASHRHPAWRRTARLTLHARRRCQEMGLPTKSVKAAVAAPEVDVPAHRGLRLLVAGVLAVVYDPAAHQVVTVLWAQGDSRAGGPVRREAC